ncbi:MAG: M6 family metalloprotease domain-containing protein [Solirubrobacterales bacterium]
MSAGVVAALMLLAAPAASQARSSSDCTLTGSGQEGATDLAFYHQPGPVLKASMIFVDFPDHHAAGAESPPQTTIGPDLTNWATAYFNEASYGRTQLDVKMDDAWLRMSKNASQYDPHTFEGQRAYIQEAVALADASGFDFSGRQTVYVVGAESGGALPNSPAFSAPSDRAINVDGTAIRWGSTLGDDAHDSTDDYGSHILAHETGHTFGLPDLYRYGAPDFASTHPDVGSWDLMGWIGPGLHLSAWHKRKIGWLEPSEWLCVHGEQTAHIAPLSVAGGTKMMVAQTSPSTAIVAEVRGPLGFDAEMCDTGGVLIYEVDANGGTGAGNGVPPIRVLPAAPSPSPGYCAALTKAPYGVEPGQVSTFSQGAVSVQVLSGSPTTGYEVRMTGPELPAGTVGLEPKLKLKGTRSARASLSCPVDTSGCEGELALALSRKTKLGKAAFDLPAGADEDLTIKIKGKGRRALKKALAQKPKAKATATLTGPEGSEKIGVKLVSGP